MNKVYFTEEQNSEEALKNALRKALSIISDESEINTIILLFPSLTIANHVLSGVLPSLTKGKRCGHFDNPPCGIQVETLKCFSPSIQHVLIPVFVTEKEMKGFEDEWDARIWIVVPYNYNNMEKWLQVHSAESVSTGQVVTLNRTQKKKIINAIEWLGATSYPNEGFGHPLDLNRLKCMANALATIDVDLDYYSVLHYCITHGINHDGGRKIADHFVNARIKRFKTDGNYPLSFLTEMMSTKHYRI